MSTLHLHIDNLTEDATGLEHLEKSLESVPGVHSVEIDSANRRAVIEHEGADPRKLAAAAAEEGYKAEVKGV